MGSSLNLQSLQGYLKVTHVGLSSTCVGIDGSKLRQLNAVNKTTTPSSKNEALARQAWRNGIMASRRRMVDTWQPGRLNWELVAAWGTVVSDSECMAGGG
jgi:hypothetical protein